MRIALTIPGFAVAIFVVSAATASADPFDLRGIQLGITLPEFRRIPHPDKKPAKVICSTDAQAENQVSLSVYGDAATAGAIACNFFDPLESLSSIRGAGLNVATVEVYMEYKFIGDPTKGGLPALYSMIVASNVQSWSKFWGAYTEKHGKPRRLSNAPTQNKMGATFDNVNAVWDNGLSTITLIKRFGQIDHPYIFYEHTRLASEIKRLVQVKKGRPSDKL